MTTLVDSRVSYYFKRRKMFPTQDIKEESSDGSLVISYRVGNYEAIENIMKSWIPHITITAPKEFRESFLADVKGWVLKQGKGYNPTERGSILADA